MRMQEQRPVVPAYEKLGWKVMPAVQSTLHNVNLCREFAIWKRQAICMNSWDRLLTYLQVKLRAFSSSLTHRHVSSRNDHMRIRVNLHLFLSSLTRRHVSSRNNHMRIRVNQHNFLSSLTYLQVRVREITGWSSWLQKPTDHFRGTLTIMEESDAGWVARYAWVCICILDGGHFSIPDADADPGTSGLALSPTHPP